MRGRRTFGHLGAVAALAVATAGVVSPSAAGEGAARFARLTVAEFHAPSPHGKGITCAMYDRAREPGTVLCESYGPGRESIATLDAHGRVAICATRNPRENMCDLGNAGEGTPTFGYGRRITVGRFRCLVLRKGVECRITATGKGFLFNPARAVRVGGALPAPLHLEEFRSPDGTIGCLVNEGVPPGYELICNALSGHPRQASISKQGEVSVCNKDGTIGASSCGLGFPHGPTLAYGQKTEAHGFSCTSATNGITCIKVEGAGKGKGFRINTNEAVEVG
jgi:hypothetical protein